MNPTEQREAIAKACGWKTNPFERDYHRWIRADGVHANLPDYLNDLNAMHEAEKKLSLEQRHHYYQRLWHICDKSGRMASVGEWLVPTATASQRAEAFLRTLNLWED